MHECCCCDFVATTTCETHRRYFFKITLTTLSRFAIVVFSVNCFLSPFPCRRPSMPVPHAHYDRAGLTGKELLFKTLRHEPTSAIPWVPFAGVHVGLLKGHSARAVLTDPDKLLESLLEANRLYTTRRPAGGVRFADRGRNPGLQADVGRRFAAHGGHPPAGQPHGNSRPPARGPARAACPPSCR